MGAAIAGLALVALGACGGAGDDAKAEPGPSPEKIELADACVEANQAAEEALVSIEGLALPDSLDAFAGSLDEISKRADSEGHAALSELASQAREASDGLSNKIGLDRTDAGIAMLDAYNALQHTCAEVGAELIIPRG